MQSSETLYDQKPEESVVVTATSPSSARSSFSSRFDYVDSVQARDQYLSSSTQVVGHVAPPKSTGFFEEFDMYGGEFQKKPITTSSKVQK